MIGRFSKSESGNIAVIMALSTLPLLLFVGSTVDYTRAAAASDKLRAATDAATLNRTQDAKNGTSMAAIGAKIKAQVIAQTGDPNVTMPSDPTLSSGGTTMCVDTVSFSRNKFIGVLKVATIPIAAHSCTSFNMDSFEIALAVDNSGSMSNSAGNGKTKMQAAIAAAKDLVSTMSSTPTASPRTAFSVVPFAAVVNIGAANKSKSYMDVGGDSSFHFESFQLPSGVSYTPSSKFSMFTSLGVSWGGCVEERPSPYTTSDTAASTSTPNTLFVPYLYPDESDDTSSAVNDYLDDDGGVCSNRDKYYTADKNYGNNDGQTKVCKYKSPDRKSGSSRLGSSFPVGPNVLCSTNALTPLTTVVDDVNDAIDDMAALGDTNIMTGLMWGWRTISPNGPFNADAGTGALGNQKAKAYGYVNASGGKNHKVIVLLTDGDNHWGGQASDGGAYNGDPNKSVYSAFGFIGENRIGTSSAPTSASNAYTQMNTSPSAPAPTRRTRASRYTRSA